eukprot:TRINITY_DN58113_c0_g1_i1.p1 TRINITY_DN58113_c0_g1~~TRINITY_DN58113_c0_g1_i1.p1  ORF type:complete len:768 (-),score=71.74 TRINITY_DN58113_c0_g1_i1:493-2742(-)
MSSQGNSESGQSGQKIGKTESQELTKVILDDTNIPSPQLPFTIKMKEGQKISISMIAEKDSLVMRIEEESSKEVEKEDLQVRSSKQLQQKLKEMDILRGLGLTVEPANYSKPFIALVLFQVKAIREWKSQLINVELQAQLELDSSDFILSGQNSTKGNILFNEDAKFAFIRLFSDSSLTFIIRDTNPGVLSGAVLSLAKLEQGTHNISLPINLDNNKQTFMGYLDIELEYKFLRGTSDDFQYEGQPSFLLEPRRIRDKLNINSRMEYLQIVNHWLLSHDNIYCVSETEEVDDLPQEERQVEGGEQEDDGSDYRDCDSNPYTQPYGEIPQRTKSYLYNGVLASAERQVQGMIMGHTPSVSPLWLEALRKKLLSCMVMSCQNVNVQEEPRQQEESFKEVVNQMYQDTQSNSIEGDQYPHISGRFEYGFGKPARHRLVGLASYKFWNTGEAKFTRDAIFIGNYYTDSRGLLQDISLPESMRRNPGLYDVWAFLPEDNTYAKGSMFMLQPGTPCIVFDLDGTITVGDQEIVTQVALSALGGSLVVSENIPRNYDLKARNHALTAVRMWAAKGYQIIYLSGRQGSFYNLTLEWLIKHDYPPGPIHLTRTHWPTLPVYQSVGNFKVKYMELLKTRGLQMYAAYGNTGTDIRAYEVAGIPKNRTFIVGPHGGKRGTVKVSSFTEHIFEIMKFPDADPAIPYVELLQQKLPKYKRNRNKGGDNYDDVSSETSNIDLNACQFRFKQYGLSIGNCIEIK